MLNISKDKVLSRIRLENPWWETGRIDLEFAQMKRRAYFGLFAELVNTATPLSRPPVRRAPILMGPRRVGKTVLLFHLAQSLIDGGFDPRRICYLSVEHPLYNGLGLEELAVLSREASGGGSLDGCVFMFDEVQYLKDWEVHLKSLVDTYRNTTWIASGSAAAALRLKSNESGAGRFSDFILPPLTFHEYVTLVGQDALLVDEGSDDGWFSATDLSALNELFIAYLNFGGYPEVALSEVLQRDPGRYVRSDIIDKVLLRDLPSLYGIADIQELNSLFTSLAYNTANEVSLEKLSQRAGIAKNTIKRYVDYLEAAFLVKRVHRIDHTARRFQRANYFKIYLTNPSLKAALFSPVRADDAEMGAMVETALFAQWFHSTANETLHYARWKNGEVDLVELADDHAPVWVCEAKWSDRYAEEPGELNALIEFCKTHELREAVVTTRTVRKRLGIEGIALELIPASEYCYTIGFNAVQSQTLFRLPVPPTPAYGPE